MKRAAISLLVFFCAAAHAQQEVRLWHAMSGSLGNALETLVSRFNESQNEARVVLEHKGSYEDTLIGALKAQRAGDGPALVQVYEVGTANMMAAKSAYRPLWQLAHEQHLAIDAKLFVPAVASYFSDASGRLLALPFNISTPILFYNKDAFRLAKLDPDKPPATWYEMPKAMGALSDAGYQCVYTTTWPSWIQIENMSVWHAQDFATKDNGMDGPDAKLVFNTHLMVRHVSMLTSWARSGYFTYSGRRLEGEKLFAAGRCAMLTAASSSSADMRRLAAFDFGVGRLPYYDDIKGAPHHSLIGGAGLWVLAGRKPAEYRAIARFLAWLMRPEIQAEWHQKTGYVPITQAAYELTRKQGYYDVHPGQKIALEQLLLHAPTRESRGIRLGDFEQVRAILDEELEGAWNDTVPPKLALDRAAERGNEVLRKFERANHGGAEPPIPKRAPRGKSAKK